MLAGYYVHTTKGPTGCHKHGIEMTLQCPQFLVPPYMLGDCQNRRMSWSFNKLKFVSTAARRHGLEACVYVISDPRLRKRP